MLIDLLALRACRFDPRPSDPPMARILESGDVLHVGMQWPVDELGIPGPEAEIVALWRGRTLGRFVLTPTPGEPVSQERRAVAALLEDRAVLELVVIGGERPNAADFQIAACIRLALTFEQLYDPIAARPAGQHALRLCPRFKGRVARVPSPVSSVFRRLIESPSLP